GGRRRRAWGGTERGAGGGGCWVGGFCGAVGVVGGGGAGKGGGARSGGGQGSKGSHIGRAAINRPLTTENQSEYEPNPERGQDRFRRVLADVLLAIVLKSADATPRIIPYPFRAAPIFIGDCARGRAEIFRGFAGVDHTTLCLFFHLRRNRGAFVHLGFVSHRISLSSYLFKLSAPMLR